MCSGEKVSNSIVRTGVQLETEGKTGASMDRAQQRLLRGWSSCPEGEAEGLLSLEKRGFQGNQSKLPVLKGVREVEPNFSLQCSEDKR